MRAVWTIAAKDLRERLRDRSAIVLGFVAPVVIAGLMSLAFNGVTHFHFSLVVVDHDRGAVASALIAQLESKPVRGVATVTLESSTRDASDSVHHRHAGAALVIPAGFSAAVTAGRSASLGILTSVDQPLPGQVAHALASAFAAQIDADHLAVETALASGAAPAQLAALVAKAATLRRPEPVVTGAIGRHPLTPISYYAPGMAIFFVLFAIGFGSRSFFAERRDGTLDRMVAAPITPIAILAGKALSVFVYGLTSLATMAVITSALFHARWGPLPAAALLCILMALSVVAMTALVITLARTERQAEGLASMFAFGFALLGGNFVMVSGEPAIMRRLALATPNGWALRGFTDLATDAGARAVLAPALAIGAITLALGSVAVARAHRTIVQ